MTYQIINTATRQQVATGLTLADAARYCQQNRRFIFIPAAH